jgi:hypothetical protein
MRKSLARTTTERPTETASQRIRRETVGVIDDKSEKRAAMCFRHSYRDVEGADGAVCWIRWEAVAFVR